MVNHYLLWATGADKPGIVAAVTKALFDNGCNIEDSSMLRLGSEFGILLIYSSPRRYSLSSATALFKAAAKKFSLAVNVKPLSKKEAAFRPAKKGMYLVSLHGADRPGLVYQLTACLAKSKFNVTDLMTHRTDAGTKPGYVLFVEGELPSSPAQLEKELAALAKKLSTKIQIRPLADESI